MSALETPPESWPSERETHSTGTVTAAVAELHPASMLIMTATTATAATDPRIALLRLISNLPSAVAVVSLHLPTIAR